MTKIDEKRIAEIGPNTQYLRPKQAASYLQIGVSTLWKWVLRNDFPKPVKAGPRVCLFERAALDAYLRGQV